MTNSLLKPIKTWKSHTCSDKYRDYNKKHVQAHSEPSPYVKCPVTFDKVARIEKANLAKRQKNERLYLQKVQKAYLQGKDLPISANYTQKLVVERTPLKTFVVKKRGV